MLPLLCLPVLIQTTPPLAPPATAQREVAFPGFNQQPLKGTVRTAEGRGFFAVMVAGSGPTDRDWSNPLIREALSGKVIPSHGGRDFAAWLGNQGIGSLRYDKRFFGSRDPKLDISLDAQVGDIRAAMAFARTLPEAKGRKLLLVGHSEGALLSLLAVRDADALLLLALPPQSMARTILAQVKPQLPPDLAGPNLDYLERVFKAIRTGQPVPEGSAQVFPGVVGLAKALMQPESVGFVRDTLDLDPWNLAARVAVPCAAVWGDRDVQTWKPAVVPETFPGTVLEIREANHLLKRETRSRPALNGATALSAYSDDTPLADLAPLAAWLQGLK